MCKKSGETTYHLLLHCEVVNELWDLILCLWGCNGSCLDGWWIYSLVGKEDLLGTISQAYGMPFPYASCGLFGENAMHMVLKTLRKQF